MSDTPTPPEPRPPFRRLVVFAPLSALGSGKAE
jgi:hypothetical protein